MTQKSLEGRIPIYQIFCIILKFFTNLQKFNIWLNKQKIYFLNLRAWNMIDHTILVDGKEAPGPLVDMAILMSHAGERLYRAGSGPWFFLPKLESAEEAALWDKIFTWLEKELRLKHGTIKVQLD